MLVDWIWVQRRRTPADAFFEHPHSLPQWISPPAAVAFAVGLAFSIWFGDIAPAWFDNQVPMPFVGGLLGAAIYAGLAVWQPAGMARLLPGAAKPAGEHAES